MENECLIFDDNELAPSNLNNAYNEHKYKYPKNIYGQIFPACSGSGEVFCSTNSTLSIEFPFAENNSASFLCIENRYVFNEQKTSSNIKLELKPTDHPILLDISMKNSKSNSATEKLALEDWLDDVL